MDAACVADNIESQSRSLLGHPRGLAFIAFTEAWERFSFYGMQSLLVLYMAGHLLQPGNIEAVAGFAGLRGALEMIVGPLTTQALATQLFGLYAGLVYFTPIVGGALGDRVLGRTRAVLWGAALMAVGHFLMAFERSFLGALAVLIVGSGLLKGNLAAQVGGLYEKGDSRRDGAFVIYNVAINVGALVAPLVCGTLGENYGWHYGFAAAGFGMLISIAIYIRGRRHLPADAPTRKTRAAGLTRSDLPVLTGLLCLYLIVTTFWVALTQIWNSYPLWIQARVDRALFQWTFPVTWFQSIDNLAVLICAPLILRFWQRRGQQQRSAVGDDLVKIGSGCALFAAACLLLTTAELLSAGKQVAFAWPAVFHILYAVAVLYVGPVTMSLISRTAPNCVNAMMVSGYYLPLFAGGIVSGWLGRFYEQMSPAMFWLMHGAIAGAGTLLIMLLHRPLTWSLQGGADANAIEPAVVAGH
jgi:POT family proton-dependent oligopeptide transporter